MPRATVSSDTTKLDLTSLPGGYVELRKLTYGEVLTRRDLGMKIEMGRPGQQGRMQLDNADERSFAFSKAIVDHNLEDENGTKLNMKDKNVILSLEPNVAQEIEAAIDEMNGTGDEFSKRLSASSTPNDPVQNGS